ncbi:MAG: hypothetical protein WBP81_04130 [Solirubrobacteraceae bacterium]
MTEFGKEERALCAVGAHAFHTSTGEKWWVVATRPDGRLIIQAQSDGRERSVARDYWLSGVWADR